MTASYKSSELTDQAHPPSPAPAAQRLAPGLAIQVSPIQGRGCFATQVFRRGEKIADYEGELISLEEAEHRRRNGHGHCICDLDNGWCIDGKVRGNGTEFINHACAPNGLLVTDESTISIYALCDIAPGEEITVNYLTSLDRVEIPCRCRACRGQNRARHERTPEPSNA